MNFKTGLILLILAVFISGCGAIAANPTESSTATTLPLVLTATHEPTITVTIEPSTTPFISYKVTTSVDHVNIRSNPGYLFSVQDNVRAGTMLEVLGMCPGGEWINVKTQSGATGWVFHMLLQTAQNLQALPVVQPQNTQLLTGKVIDSNGQPVSGIVFNIMQGSGTDAPVTNAQTDSTGVFYAFMPMTVSGEWRVNYAGIGCSSNKMDQNCNCLNGLCGTADPSTQIVTLPQSQALVFGWK